MHMYSRKKAHKETKNSSGYHLMHHAGGGSAPAAVPPAATSVPPSTPSLYKKGGRPKFDRRAEGGDAENHAAGGAAKCRRDYPYTHMQ